MMNTWGATCIPSPSSETEAGRKMLAQDPNSPGSLGIAISEAVEDAVTSEAQGRPPTRYSLGSVLNHVMLHQTIIGQEAQKQLAKVGDYPDIVIGCAGGGSNFAGIAFPFIRDKIGETGPHNRCRTNLLPHHDQRAVCLRLRRHSSDDPVAPHAHARARIYSGPHSRGGLRYHGMAPLVSQLIVDGLIEPRAVHQLETFSAGVTWARTEGFIPTPRDQSHAGGCHTRGKESQGRRKAEDYPR